MNSIKDLTTFANNVRLPFDYRRTSGPKKAPWLLMGGSYSGALSAWTASTDPGVFWAYHASSAPVQAIENYWEYFVPVREGMPKNCSKDVSLVIDHIDSVFLNGTAEEQYNLEAMFGLQELEHAADFASAIENGVSEIPQQIHFLKLTITALAMAIQPVLPERRLLPMVRRRRRREGQRDQHDPPRC